jgi:hypothetical protein
MSTHGDGRALSGDLLPDWSGETGGHYEQLVPDLDYDLTSIPVGAGRAAVVLTDAEVADEGWLEVFRADDDAVAVLPVSAADYPAAVAAALHGAGVEAAPLRPESPGPLPVSGDFDECVAVAGAPLMRATAHGYRIWVQWMTELDEGAVFARWLFVPASGDVPSR